MGLLEALTVLLIILKVVGVIGISWLAVFSPLLIALLVYITIYLFFGLTIAGIFSKVFKSFK